MMRYSFFIICILSALLSVMAAEPGKLRGLIRDATTGEPVVGAIVRTKGAFTASDADGRFVLSHKGVVDSVSFRCIGYESLILPASADLTEVRLNQKATLLRDVIVQAPDIYARGDTLVFNVERYAKESDNAIIDVIKRLPGIKVKEDGTIEYQGKPINKFYLDGNDFIGVQYGLATDNISYNDVKSVEVMENHQPVKALEGIEFPEEAGINLKLKDDARSRWVGVAQATAGVQPLLYDGSLFGMRLAPRIQNMFTLKADNTGWNPANEIQEHDMDIMFSHDYTDALWPEYISADIVNVPLSEKRTRDNISWLANAITAWKSGDTSMRIKLNYMGDRLDYRSGIVTDYFSEQIPAFIQKSTQRARRHELSAQFYSETNKRGYYLKDNFTLSARWDESDAAVAGSFDLLQSVNRKGLSARNDLRLVKRNDKKLFTLTSRTTFDYRPDRLAILGDENAIQKTELTDVRSTTETRMGRLTRFWKYYLTAGIDLDYHRMHARLSGLGAFDNDGIYETFWSNIYATPQIDYERNGWRLSLCVPLSWVHYTIAGQHDYINTSPKLSFRRQLTAKSELSGALYYGLGSSSPYLNIDVPILSDYRNLFIAANADKYIHDEEVSMAYRYRNPMKAMFVNMTAAYRHRRSGQMSSQLFIDEFIISTYADRLSDSNTWYLKGGLSKGLGHSRIVIGVDASLSVTSASSLRDNLIVPYRQTMAELNPYFKGSIIRWLSANYEIDYGFSKLDVDQNGNSSQMLHQNFFITIIPDDKVQFVFGGEHFMTRFPEGSHANLILLDASAVWKLNHKIRLTITSNNLLDSKRYEYMTYGTISRSAHTFNIRPRSILASMQYRF